MHVPTEKRKITIIIIIIITIWKLESGQRGGGRGAEGERVTERGGRGGKVFVMACGVCVPSWLARESRSSSRGRV